MNIDTVDPAVSQRGGRGPSGAVHRALHAQPTPSGVFPRPMNSPPCSPSASAAPVRSGPVTPKCGPRSTPGCEPAINGRGVWVKEYINETLPHLLAAGELVPEEVVIPTRPRPAERMSRWRDRHVRARASYCHHVPTGSRWTRFRVSGSGHSWGADRKCRLVETTTVKWPGLRAAWKFPGESSAARFARAAAKRARRAERNRKQVNAGPL